MDYFQKHYRYRAQNLEADAEENSAFSNKKQVALELLHAQRRALTALRKRGELHEDAVRRTQNDLDLEEQSLHANG